MFAVIKTGGKQYRVAANDLLKIEKVEAKVGDIVEIGNVLAHGEGENVTFGAPFVDGALVTAEVVEQGKNRTVIAFKKRRRQNSRRKIGHRQLLTTVRIAEILLGGAKPAKKAAVKAEAKAEVAAGAKAEAAPKEAKAKKEAAPKAEVTAETAAAPLFKAPKGEPIVTLSPSPWASTRPISTIWPTSPATRSISSVSSAATRYCLPPVLMTANIICLSLFVRPCGLPARRESGPAVFLSVCYGFKNKLARERPTPSSGSP